MPISAHLRLLLLVGLPGLLVACTSDPQPAQTASPASPPATPTTGPQTFPASPPPASPPAVPAPPPAAPAPAPEAQAPELVWLPSGAVELVPDPQDSCQGHKLHRIHPACPAGLTEDDLLIEPGLRVGVLRGGVAPDLASLCRYGTVVEVGTDLVAWYGPDRFSSVDDAAQQFSSQPMHDCETLSWAPGVISLDKKGLVTELHLSDTRFHTAGGARPGLSLEALKQALPGGEMVPGVFDGEQAYEAGGIKAAVDMPGEPLHELVVQLPPAPRRPSGPR